MFIRVTFIYFFLNELFRSYNIFIIEYKGIIFYIQLVISLEAIRYYYYRYLFKDGSTKHVEL